MELRKSGEELRASLISLQGFVAKNIHKQQRRPIGPWISLNQEH